eukprot:SAG11_NODE_330_length_10677_cov_8.535117_2_plen_168_part_00
MKAFRLSVLFVLGGGACAAAGAVATNFTADGAAASFDKAVGGLEGLGVLQCTGESICTGARSGFSPFSGYGSDDVLTNTMNLAGVGSAAPDFSHFYGFPLDGYVYSDLLQGSGGEKQIDISPILGALGRTLAQPFSFLGSLIRCDSALRTSGGGGGVGAAPSPAPLP